MFAISMLTISSIIVFVDAASPSPERIVSTVVHIENETKYPLTISQVYEYYDFKKLSESEIESSDYNIQPGDEAIHAFELGIEGAAIVISTSTHAHSHRIVCAWRLKSRILRTQNFRTTLCDPHYHTIIQERNCGNDELDQIMEQFYIGNAFQRMEHDGQESITHGLYGNENKLQVVVERNDEGDLIFNFSMQPLPKSLPKKRKRPPSDAETILAETKRKRSVLRTRVKRHEPGAESDDQTSYPSPTESESGEDYDPTKRAIEID